MSRKDMTVEDVREYLKRSGQVIILDPEHWDLFGPNFMSRKLMERLLKVMEEDDTGNS